MHQQSGMPFYKSVVVTLVAFAFILLASALVTALGSHSAFAASTDSTSSFIDTSDMSGSPNMVTATVGNIVNSLNAALSSTGTALYRSCRSITNATASSGKAVAHGSAVMATGAWHGTTWAGRTIGHGTMAVLHTTGSGVMFTLRLPGKLFGSMPDIHVANAVLRPADDKPTPKITNELPTALMAQIAEQAKQDSQKQQRANALFQAQLAANERLGGAIIAGDPTHGGYPTKWDYPVSQDSRLDSWGMYNRECVSYTAWKVYQTFGHMPYWGGVGNANEWPGDARRAGIPTGSTPRVHAVAVSMRGYYGHTMWVEAVRGNMIYVSQYNYHLDGRYSEMWVDGSNFTYIYFK